MSVKSAFAFATLWAALAAGACRGPLPDDLPSLVARMGENDESVSVDSTNKVRRLFGKAGLVQALRDGRPTARSRAAFRLRDFPDPQTEQLLMQTASQDADFFVKVQALWTLAEIGTASALPTIDQAVRDAHPEVASMARDAAQQVRRRESSRTPGRD